VLAPELNGVKTLSLFDFNRLEEPDELSRELDRAEPVRMAGRGPPYNRLYRTLDGHLESHGVGEAS
jgi:hypothetical protein